MNHKHHRPTSGQLVRFLEAIGNRERARSTRVTTQALEIIEHRRSAYVVSPDAGATVVGSPADDTPASAANAGGVLSAILDSDDSRAADLLLIQQMRAVICDFLPNVGVCALQNYGLLNSVLVDSRRVLSDAGMVVPEGHK